MKKIINAPDKVIQDMIEGMRLASPDIRILPGTSVIVRADAPVKGKVGLISGGGSGHEPAHGGFVGTGMLDAACAGDVFTSPSVDQMMEAVRAVDSGQGVLIIAKNYTGDNLNFDMAMELLADEGIRTEKVVVHDDIAVEESPNTTGRRGVAGTVLVQKVAAACAEQGNDLETVKRAAQDAADHVRTFGFALSPCTIPSVGKPSFSLAEDEMELGTGIHGEAGVKRMKVPGARALAEQMTEAILKDMPVESGEEVCVLVNGMGATPLMELYIIYKEVHSLLTERGIKIAKAYVGEYMTSLEMAGASVSVMKLDEKRKQYLLAPADTLGFKQFASKQSEV
ncbi:MAG: dihydroxyacetone kinase subunit DhaK [Eubacteriales bacterium]|nr:dihydroxyacetone kinase subunit DhaK [Eubacteriales bacterium]